jgi:CRP/FNR family transcriptional regulator, cyclic AMP receptor protein
VAVTLGHQATVNCLEAVDPLRDCTRKQLEEVARLAERVQVGEGEVLAREGRIGREFFLILSGKVAVTREGRRINSLGPGNFFGELAAMNPGPRNATVTALSELDVLIIGPREFAAMANIPGFRDALVQSMARRLREADAQIAEATVRHERALPAPNDKPDPARRPAPDGSASDERPTSHNLTPSSHRRWG